MLITMGKKAQEVFFSQILMLLIYFRSAAYTVLLLSILRGVYQWLCIYNKSHLHSSDEGKSPK